MTMNQVLFLAVFMIVVALILLGFSGQIGGKEGGGTVGNVVLIVIIGAASAFFIKGLTMLSGA